MLPDTRAVVLGGVKALRFAPTPLPRGEAALTPPARVRSLAVMRRPGGRPLFHATSVSPEEKTQLLPMSPV
jgi:hypothetical protein